MPNDVKFDEPGMEYGRGPRGPRRSFLVGTVIKLGLAKNDKQAGIVLIVVAVIAVALAFIFWPSGDDYVPVPQPGQDVARVQ